MKLNYICFLLQRDDLFLLISSLVLMQHQDTYMLLFYLNMGLLQPEKKNLACHWRSYMNNQLSLQKMILPLTDESPECHSRWLGWESRWWPRPWTCWRTGLHTCCLRSGRRRRQGWWSRLVRGSPQEHLKLRSISI